jgi:hypothetical protein
MRLIDFYRIVAAPAELEPAVDKGLEELSLGWNTSSS